MTPGKLTFSSAQLNRQFPFYILINTDLSIDCTGLSLAKMIGDCSGHCFTDHFLIKRPQYETVNFDILRAGIHQFILLEISNEQGNILKGEFEFLEDSCQLLFTGSLWLNSLQELHKSTLTNTDFANHDSITDLLHLLQIQEVINYDLKQLLNKVNQQKKELNIAALKNKEIAASLEETNERFGYVSRATADAVWDWDILKGTIHRGEGFNKLFGHKGSNITERMHFWKEHIHPEDIEDIITGIDKILGSDAVNWSREYRFRKNDGSYAYVLDKGFVVRGEANEPLRMVGAMQDITERKEEEIRLRLLESVITTIHEAVLIFEPVDINSNRLKIAYTNPAFTEMTGYTSDEVIGKAPYILLGPKSDEAVIRAIVDAVERQVHIEAEILHYKKNKEEHWVSVSLNPMLDKNGDLTHWIGIHRDITANKKATEEIARQKKFWEDILNNLPSDLCVCDSNHNYLFMNHHGIKDAATREWIIGKNDFDFFKRKGADEKIALMRRAQFNRAIESGNLVEWLEESVSAEGVPKYMIRKYYPYFEEDNLRFIIGYGVDITDRKLAEIKMNEALEAMQKSNDDLEQFAYVASHDLQEPLRMVASFLTLLEKKCADRLDGKGVEYIRYAVDGAKRMQQLILDLLEYSRVGRTDAVAESVNLNDVMKEIISFYAPAIKEKKARVIYHGLPTLRILKAPLRQVFQNLISNSLKYTDVVVAPVVEVSAEERANNWEFSFKDNGIGIEPHHFERIFVIFQRLHTRQKYSGTGIGLAITKKIVENLGGTIRLESELGKGTTFYVTIPGQIKR